MVDVNKNIYIENKEVLSEIIKANIRKIVNNTPAMKYNGVHYRIFGDESLLLGTIMDVNNELIAAFNPTYTSSSRYLLNLKAHDMDGRDWINQLNKLDLKAIKKN